MLDPRITRRDFLKAASLLAVPAAYPYAATAAAGGRAQPAAYAYAYVGTYTPNGGGIYLFRLDRASGAMTQMQVFDDIRNPSWLAINPAQTRLYAVSEIDDYQGTRGGAVVSYAIDGEESADQAIGRGEFRPAPAPRMPACILPASSCSSPTTAAAMSRSFPWDRTAPWARRRM